MAYQFALDAPARYQFESSSGSLYSSQVFNCGPTVVTRIAQYMRDQWYGIESNRPLIKGMGPYNVNGIIVYGAPASMPTNAWQQRDMLRARGVACEVYGIPSVTALHALVDNGRRPVLLGMNYALIVNEVAGHGFNDWHAVAVLTGAWVNGVRGFIVNDPNFSPPGGPRPDSHKGKRFYPDSVMARGLSDPDINWAVVPIDPKPAPKPPPPPALTEAQEMAILSNVRITSDRPFKCKAGVTLRKGPGTSYPVHWRTPSEQEFIVHGFAPNGWVLASRSLKSTGLFFVPPEH